MSEELTALQQNGTCLFLFRLVRLLLVAVGFIKLRRVGLLRDTKLGWSPEVTPGSMA